MLRFRDITAAVAAIPLIASTAPAHATDNQDDTAQNQNTSTVIPELQQVTVTAERRPQLLQSVPESVAVVTNETLKEMGATDFSDYLNSIPDVDYSDSGGYKDKIFIRGLSDSLSSRVLSTTAIYVDETPITEVDASLADIGTFDINRVEVLRGPQGTLYGSEAMGGAVRLITNKPDLNSYSALVEASGSGTQHGGGNYDSNAMINAPIVDGILGLRLVIGYKHDDGFIDNIYTNQTDVNPDTSKFARALLDAKPIENLDILLSFQYVDSIVDEGPFQDIGLPQYEESRAYPEVNDFNTRIYAATVNYTLPWATLTSATSYIDKTNYSIRDVTPIFGSLFDQNYSAATGVTPPSNTAVGLVYRFPNLDFVEDFRLQSARAGLLHWLVGVYYEDFTPTDYQTTSTTYLPGNDFSFYAATTDVVQREMSEYADVTYDVTRKWSVEIGARHEHYSITSDAIGTGALYGGQVVSDSQGTQSAVSPKYEIYYKATADHLLYAEAAKGIRPGGVNGEVPSVCLQSLEELGYTSAGQVYQYRPDSVWDYELGSKNSFYGRSLAVNGDAYYIKWPNSQVAQNLACGDQIISNAGGATSKGVEMDLQGRPARDLELTLGGAYNEATFNNTSQSVQTLSGATLPNAPKWTVDGSAQYERMISADVKGYFYTDVSYISGRWSDLPLVVPNYREPGYTIVNARVGLQKDAWDVALFVKNLANEVAILNTNADTGYNYQVINRPRTVGIQVERQF